MGMAGFSMDTLSLLLGQLQKMSQNTFSITYKINTNVEQQLSEVSTGLIDITPPMYDLTIERAEKVKYITPCLFQYLNAFWFTQQRVTTLLIYLNTSPSAPWYLHTVIASHRCNLQLGPQNSRPNTKELPQSDFRHSFPETEDIVLEPFKLTQNACWSLSSFYFAIKRFSGYLVQSSTPTLGPKPPFLTISELDRLIGSSQYYLISIEGWAETDRLLKLNDHIYVPLRFAMKGCGPEILKIFGFFDDSIRFLEEHPGSVFVFAFQRKHIEQVRSSKNLFVILDSESGVQNLCIILPKGSGLHDDLQICTMWFLAAGLEGRIMEWKEQEKTGRKKVSG